METKEERETLQKWDAVWTLFHRLWGHCKESPEYDKGDWKNLQARLQDMQEHPSRVDRRKKERRKGGVAIFV